MARVVVVGQGYVGVPMALAAAHSGMLVVGLDTDERLVASLNAGVSHVGDVSVDDLARGLAAGYRATTDVSCLAGADVVLVCVPTPLTERGAPDLAAVRAAARAIGVHVRRRTLVVLESTSYPGTTEEVFAPLVLTNRFTAGHDLYVAFSPERVDPGNALFDVQHIPKVVGGLTKACTTAAAAFYEEFIESVICAKGAKEAAMAKLLETPSGT